MKITIQYDSGQYDVIESNSYTELKARAIAEGFKVIGKLTALVDSIEYSHHYLLIDGQKVVALSDCRGYGAASQEAQAMGLTEYPMNVTHPMAKPFLDQAFKMGLKAVPTYRTE